MKEKKNVNIQKLISKRIRFIKKAKKSKIKIRKKIFFKNKKVKYNNSEEKTNYSENQEDFTKESHDYYYKLKKIIEKLSKEYNVFSHNYSNENEKDIYFINKINNIINQTNKSKINIILDIDQTLVYSQALKSIEQINFINNLNVGKKDFHFILFTMGNTQYFYFVQVRPGLKEFISKLTPYCNFYINSMANPHYVRTVLLLLNQKYNLILNNDGKNNVFITPGNEPKTLPYELAKDGNFLILDDNIYAWDKSYLNNIIPVQKFCGFFNYENRNNNYKNEAIYQYYFSNNKIYCINDYEGGLYDKNNKLPFCCEASWSEINQLNYIADIIIKIFLLRDLFKFQVCFSFYNIINNILKDCFIFYEGENEDFFKELVMLLGGKYIKNINKATHILINNNFYETKKFDNYDKKRYNIINIKWLFDSFFSFVKRDENNYKLNEL